MIIYSFGSGFQIESSDPSYISKIKTSIDYAKRYGIEVGAVSDRRRQSNSCSVVPVLRRPAAFLLPLPL